MQGLTICQPFFIAYRSALKSYKIDTMNYFLAKTEADEYSIDDLKKDHEAPWTGVNNPQAKAFLRSMKKGDKVYIYHTGNIRAIVGLGEVATEGDVPHFRYLKTFDPAIATLAQVKAEKQFEDLRLVRQSRLSVMDVPPHFLAWLQKREK